METATYATMNTYLHALRERIRDRIGHRVEHYRESPQPPDPPIVAEVEQAVEALDERIEAQVTELVETNPLAQEIEEARVSEEQFFAAQYKKAMGMDVLRNAVAKLDMRIRHVMQLEMQGQGMLTSEGTAALDVLRKCGADMGRLEMGGRLFAARALHNGINPSNVDAASQLPLAAGARDFMDEFQALNEVDQNLIIGCTEKVIDTIQETVSGVFTAGGLGSAEPQS
jgi:hypothetical protein